ncbi:MAG: glycosyl hydrolase family 65 protein, partial [Actinomycetota bacterium]
ISTRAGPGWVERVVAVARAAYDDDQTIEEAVAHVGFKGIPGLVRTHRAAWAQRWRDADVVIGGDIASQRAMRFALHHLIAAADPESDAASIGARGLTGPGYNGHVFWDTDVFMVPFFIYSHPPTARSLLAYRYRTLPAARRKAAGCGYRGALYPWESADTGEDVTPEYVWLDGIKLPVVTALEQHHISADVAWTTWQYWRATGDEAFLFEMGAEMILETARFWASRASKGSDGRYHIDRAMGPDEYHESVRDNAFTNVLARWNLKRGLELADLVGRIDLGAWNELRGRLTLSDEELEHWRLVVEGLVDGFDPQTLLYEQFSGFFGLEDVRAADLAPRPFSGERVLGVSRLRRCQVIKQADVLMLAHMLPEVVPAEVAAANYRFYEPRTSHGSSLSPAIHAGVAARIGDLKEAVDLFRMAGGIDLDDRMGNSHQGLHLATMGGLWQAAVLGFGGLRPDGEAVRIDPRLPPSWDRLAFPVRWRESRLEVETDGEAVQVSVEGRACVALGDGTPRWLRDGRYRGRMTAAGWSDLNQIT